MFCIEKSYIAYCPNRKSKSLIKQKNDMNRKHAFLFKLSRSLCARSDILTEHDKSFRRCNDSKCNWNSLFMALFSIILVNICNSLGKFLNPTKAELFVSYIAVLSKVFISCSNVMKLGTIAYSTSFGIKMKL